jgi:hypothetical protein
VFSEYEKVVSRSFNFQPESNGIGGPILPEHASKIGQIRSRFEIQVSAIARLKKNLVGEWYKWCIWHS